MNQFKAIESIRMRAKRVKRKKEMGEKFDPGRAWLGKKMDKHVVYTSLAVSEGPMLSILIGEFDTEDPSLV